MIRVVLADDHRLVLSGIATILDTEDDIEVVATAADGEEAERVVRRLRPDVVLMDIRMPGIGGLEAAGRIIDDPSLPQVKIVMLTTYDLDEHVYAALRMGASGFIVKDAEAAELIHGVRVVARGEALLSPTVTRRLLTRVAPRLGTARSDPRLGRLTARERQVLGLVGGGLSNDEIGTRLGISPTTAKTHVSRVMTKLGARDRAQLVVHAYETGLIRAEGVLPGAD